MRTNHGVLCDRLMHISDIDILVSLNKPPGWDFFDLRDYLEMKLGVKVELLPEKALKNQLKGLIFQSVRYMWILKKTIFADESDKTSEHEFSQS